MESTLSESPSHRFDSETGWVLGWLMDFRSAAIAQDESAMREILLEVATYHEPEIQHSLMTLGMVCLQEWAHPKGIWDEGRLWVAEILRDLAISLEKRH